MYFQRENKITGFIYWVCSVRTKTNRCPAWIKQYDTSHISSNIPHNHPADPTKAGKLKASVKVCMIMRSKLLVLFVKKYIFITNTLYTSENHGNNGFMNI